MRAEIELNRRSRVKAWRGSVQLDGVEIANEVTALTLTAIGGQQPVLRLDIMLDAVRFCGDARVALPKDAHELLVAAGWTPPTDEPTGDVAGQQDDAAAAPPAHEEGR